MGVWKRIICIFKTQGLCATPPATCGHSRFMLPDDFRPPLRPSAGSLLLFLLTGEKEQSSGEPCGCQGLPSLQLPTLTRILEAPSSAERSYGSDNIPIIGTFLQRGLRLRLLICNRRKFLHKAAKHKGNISEAIQTQIRLIVYSTLRDTRNEMLWVAFWYLYAP